MREHNWNEVTITTKNPKGETATVHGEYDADGASPEDAAHEVLNATAKIYGVQRVRSVSPDR